MNRQFLIIIWGLCPLGLFQIAQALPYSFTTIDSPGAASTFLFKMNNLGQFVGTHLDPNLVSHSLLTDGRTFTVFDPPGSWGTPWPGMSAAQGINDSGQIVGYVEDTNNAQTHAYLKAGSTFSFFDHPNAGSGSPFRGTGFAGINDVGVIVGGYMDNNDEQGGFTIDANGMVTLLDHPNLPSGHQAVASDINNLGQMVGSFFDVDSNGNLIQRGFFIDGSSLTFIDVPGSSFVFANGLNDSGDIVGAFYEDATGVFRGFVLSGGMLTVLDVPGVTGTLPGTFIHDIDNRGRLVGYYGEDLTRSPFTYPRHGFLATPVPEPPLTALLGIGLAVMSFARWQKKDSAMRVHLTALASPLLGPYPESRRFEFARSLTGTGAGLALAAVVSGWPAPAGAFLFEVQVRTTDQFGAGQGGTSSSSSLPVGMSSDQNWEQIGATAQSKAVTAAGNVVSQQLIPILGARSFAHWENNRNWPPTGCALCDPNIVPFSGGHTEALAEARFLYSGFIIDGPPGVVPFSVNFFIEGGIRADRLGDNMGASASVDVFGRINSDRGDSGVFSLGAVFTCERGPGALGFSCPNTDGTNYLQGTGTLAGVSNVQGQGSFSGVAASPLWKATVGVPFEIGLELVTAAAVFEFQDGAPINFATAFSDFFNTAGLWDRGPLFNLPQGYTAHSLDGLVVDNRLVLPGSGGGGPAPVPAPPTLALFLLGAAAALASRIRRAVCSPATRCR